MRCITLTLLLAVCGPLAAQDDVRVRLVPRGAAAEDSGRPPWSGERIPLEVRLEVADGIFRGRPALDLPDTAGTTLYRLDAPPVLGSSTEAGVTWTTQSIELAAWIHAAGRTTIPPIRVRFATAASTIGDPSPRVLETAPLTLETARPPGTETLDGVLLVSSDVSVELDWTAPTNPLVPGDALRWSARLDASDVPAILLPRLGPTLPDPLPTAVAIHPDPPELTTRAPRGALEASRTDAGTLVCEGPGRVEFPGWAVHWWDPDAATLRSKEFEAIVLNVEAAGSGAEQTADSRQPDPDDHPSLWPWLLGALVLAVVLFVGRHRLTAARREFRRVRAEGEPSRFRDLRRACRSSDPRAIDRALQHWRAHPAAPRGIAADRIWERPRLEAALRHLGEAVCSASPRCDARTVLAECTALRRETASHPASRSLPPLNPGSTSTGRSSSNSQG